MLTCKMMPHKMLIQMLTRKMLTHKMLTQMLTRKMMTHKMLTHKMLTHKIDKLTYLIVFKLELYWIVDHDLFNSCKTEYI